MKRILKALQKNLAKALLKLTRHLISEIDNDPDLPQWQKNEEIVKLNTYVKEFKGYVN